MQKIKPYFQTLLLNQGILNLSNQNSLCFGKSFKFPVFSRTGNVFLTIFPVFSAFPVQWGLCRNTAQKYCLLKYCPHPLQTKKKKSCPPDTALPRESSQVVFTPSDLDTLHAEAAGVIETHIKRCSHRADSAWRA